jgi:glucose-1-phosphate thymidylyltransferase
VQAIILAAGYSTRLRPLTDNTAKPLLEIGGRPILEWILERVLPLPNLTQVLAVVNARFYEQFVDWRKGYSLRQTSGPALTLVNDGTWSNETRLGAVGDVCLALDLHGSDDDTLIVAGDNMFASDLAGVCALRQRHDASVLGVYRFEDPAQVRGRFGVVTIDGTQRVVGFEEKPEEPRSTLAATAIYLLRMQDLRHIIALHRRAHAGELNAGCLIQELLAQGAPVYSEPMSAWYDIGTPEDLERARAYYSALPR